MLFYSLYTVQNIKNKTTLFYSLYKPQFFILITQMSDTSMMISMLRKGSNGFEILQILDTITDDSVESVSQIVKVLSDTISAAVSDTEAETVSYKEPSLDFIEF
jgi:hypothetical protein